VVKCPKCGAEIKYIPAYVKSERGVIVVDLEYIKVITDAGREIQGHIRHQCPETEEKTEVA
jgi:hypothetical protein